MGFRFDMDRAEAPIFVLQTEKRSTLRFSHSSGMIKSRNERRNKG